MSQQDQCKESRHNEGPAHFSELYRSRSVLIDRSNRMCTSSQLARKVNKSYNDVSEHTTKHKRRTLKKAATFCHQNDSRCMTSVLGLENKENNPSIDSKLPSFVGRNNALNTNFRNRVASFPEGSIAGKSNVFEPLHTLLTAPISSPSNSFNSRNRLRVGDPATPKRARIGRESLDSLQDSSGSPWTPTKNLKLLTRVASQGDLHCPSSKKALFYKYASGSLGDDSGVSNSLSYHSEDYTAQDNCASLPVIDLDPDKVTVCIWSPGKENNIIDAISQKKEENSSDTVSAVGKETSKSACHEQHSSSTQGVSVAVLSSPAPAVCRPSEPYAISNPSQTREGGSKNSATVYNKDQSEVCRRDKSLLLLTERFLELFPLKCEAPLLLVLDEVAFQLNTERRRIYDIVNILESLNMAAKVGKNVYHWWGDENLNLTLARLKSLGSKLGLPAMMTAMQRSGTMFSFPSVPISPNSATMDSRREKSLGIICQKLLMLLLATPPPRVIAMDNAAQVIVCGDPSTSPVASGCRRAVSYCAESPNSTELRHSLRRSSSSYGSDSSPPEYVRLASTSCSQQRAKGRRMYDIANVLGALKLVTRLQTSRSLQYSGPLTLPELDDNSEDEFAVSQRQSLLRARLTTDISGRAAPVCKSKPTRCVVKTLSAVRSRVTASTCESLLTQNRPIYTSILPHSDSSSNQNNNRTGKSDHGLTFPKDDICFCTGDGIDAEVSKQMHRDVSVPAESQHDTKTAATTISRSSSRAGIVRVHSDNSVTQLLCKKSSFLEVVEQEFQRVMAEEQKDELLVQKEDMKRLQYLVSPVQRHIKNLIRVSSVMKPTSSQEVNSSKSGRSVSLSELTTRLERVKEDATGAVPAQSVFLVPPEPSTPRSPVVVSRIARSVGCSPINFTPPVQVCQVTDSTDGEHRDSSSHVQQGFSTPMKHSDRFPVSSLSRYCSAESVSRAVITSSALRGKQPIANVCTRPKIVPTSARQAFRIVTSFATPRVALTFDGNDSSGTQLLAPTTIITPRNNSKPLICRSSSVPTVSISPRYVAAVENVTAISSRSVGIVGAAGNGRIVGAGSAVTARTLGTGTAATVRTPGTGTFVTEHAESQSPCHTIGSGALITRGTVTAHQRTVRTGPIVTTGAVVTALSSLVTARVLGTGCATAVEPGAVGTPRSTGTESQAIDRVDVGRQTAIRTADTEIVVTGGAVQAAKRGIARAARATGTVVHSLTMTPAVRIGRPNDARPLVTGLPVHGTVKIGTTVNPRTVSTVTGPYDSMGATGNSRTALTGATGNYLSVGTVAAVRCGVSSVRSPRVTLAAQPQQDEPINLCVRKR